LAELLAAIVVLAIGMLGVVALYVDRAQEQTRNPHSIAAALVQEMADRIRSNEGMAPRLQIAPFCTPSGAPDGPSGKTDILAQDVACWQEKVARSLPNGSGMVIREDGRKGYRITVSWSEAGVGASSLVMTVEVPQT
jgi:Tfp pilus assembly protein PilV